MIESSTIDRIDRSKRTRRGLECRVGLGRIILPTESIALLGEYVVGSRLPLNDLVNYAIGVWQDSAILSVSLSRHEPVATRTTNGALLVATRPAEIGWAFEMDEPLGLVEVVELAKPGTSIPWRRSAKLADGRTVQFIDVPLMLDEAVVE
jgi:hypothetical protein